MKVSELAEAVNKAIAQLNKAKDEIIAKIQALTDALGDVELPAEAQEALDALNSSAQGLDDIVPDPVEVPPTE